MENWFKEEARLAKEIADLKEQYEGVRAIIREEMDKQELKEYQVGQRRAVIVAKAPSVSYPKDRLIAAGVTPDVLKKAEKVTTSKPYLQIRTIKAEDDA